VSSRSTFESVEVLAVLNEIDYFVNSFATIYVLLNWLVHAEFLAVDEVSIGACLFSGIPFWWSHHFKNSSISYGLLNLI
jgi:hypothetical protein